MPEVRFENGDTLRFPDGTPEDIIRQQSDEHYIKIRTGGGDLEVTPRTTTPAMKVEERPELPTMNGGEYFERLATLPSTLAQEGIENLPSVPEFIEGALGGAGAGTLDALNLPSKALGAVIPGEDIFQRGAEQLEERAIDPYRQMAEKSRLGEFAGGLTPYAFAGPAGLLGKAGPAGAGAAIGAYETAQDIVGGRATPQRAIENIAGGAASVYGLSKAHKLISGLFKKLIGLGMEPTQAKTFSRVYREFMGEIHPDRAPKGQKELYTEFSARVNRAVEEGDFKQFRELRKQWRAGKATRQAEVEQTGLSLPSEAVTTPEVPKAPAPRPERRAAPRAEGSPTFTPSQRDYFNALEEVIPDPLVRSEFVENGNIGKEYFEGASEYEINKFRNRLEQVTAQFEGRTPEERLPESVEESEALAKSAAEAKAKRDAEKVAIDEPAAPPEAKAGEGDSRRAALQRLMELENRTQEERIRDADEEEKARKEVRRLNSVDVGEFEEGDVVAFVQAMSHESAQKLGGSGGTSTVRGGKVLGRNEDGTYRVEVHTTKADPLGPRYVHDDVQPEMLVSRDEFDEFANLSLEGRPEYDIGPKRLATKVATEAPAATPEPPAAPPAQKLKIGDPQRIMGADAIVADVQTIGGVDYELYNANKLKDKRGFLRVFDSESGKAVNVMSYPTFDAAEDAYKDAVEKATRAEEPAAPPEPKATKSDDPPKGKLIFKDLRGNKVDANIRSDEELGLAPPEPKAPEAPAKPPAEPEAPKIAEWDEPTVKLAKRIRANLMTGTTISGEKLQAFAREAGFKDVAAKELYEVVEAAANQQILNDGSVYSPTVKHADQAKSIIKRLQSEIENRLPSQTKRSETQVATQQFSTPPAYGWLVNWVANIQKGNTVLEPSAGTGNIAVHAKNAGAKVVVNELDDRRLELLKGLGIADEAYKYDAGQLDALLHNKVKPDRVVMNPPFSKGSLRAGSKHGVVGADHVEAVLELLKPGGRLVAIVGGGRDASGGMSFEAPTYQEWWDKIRGDYKVRANVRVGGKVYSKYGTQFATRLLVIDKPSGELGTWRDNPITGEVADLEELTDILSEVRNDLEAPKAISETAPGERGVEPRPETTRPPAPTRPDTSVEPATGGVGERPPAGAKAGVSPVDTGQPPTEAPAAGATAGGASGRAGAGEGGVNAPEAGGVAAGSGTRKTGGTRVKSAKAPTEQVEDTQSEQTFVAYESTVNIEGAQKHLADLAESFTMAAVEPPKVDVKLNLPKSVIESGAISDAQLEPIALAVAAHELRMPDGRRFGFFTGDGTGVGKTREILGVIMHHNREGVKKHIVFSPREDLLSDMKEEAEAVEFQLGIRDLKKTNTQDDIDMDEGVLFVTYGTMTSQAGERRFQQIQDWMGEDFDGVIAIDEAHALGNLIDERGVIGGRGTSKRAVQVNKLQDLHKDSKLFYASATGATSVENLAYASRLALWGEGSPFANPGAFVDAISSGGMSAMELVAQNLKARGLYLSRSLSFEGVEVEDQEKTMAKLTPTQVEDYKTAANAWRNVVDSIEGTLAEKYGRARNAKEAREVRSQLYGAMQRFWNETLTAFMAPRIISEMKADLKAGMAPVLQMEHHYGDRLAGAVAELEDATDPDQLDALDLTPRGTLINFLQNFYPTARVVQRQVGTPPNVRTETVELHEDMDDPSSPVVEDPKLVAERDKLIDDVATFTLPKPALDQILDEFGSDKVAEITTRKVRVLKSEKTGRLAVERRSPKSARAEAAEFQDGKRDALVFTRAGGTGSSYHSDLGRKNQKRRVHYLVEPGWIASNAVQGLGRTHRTNQASAPLIKLFTTDVPGHKRFISTIARRLGQLGALTKGSKDASGQSVFTDADNLETPLAEDTLQGYLKDIRDAYDAESRFGITWDQITRDLTLRTDRRGRADPQQVDVKMFLNRILNVDPEVQETLFGGFMERYAAAIERAKAAGQWNVGTEVYKADKIELESEQSVFTDKATSADVSLIKLRAHHKTKPRTFEDIENASYIRDVTDYEDNKYEWLKNIKSGRIYRLAVNPGSSQKIRLHGPIGFRSMSRWDVLQSIEGKTPHGQTAKWTEPTRGEAKKLWDAEVAEIPEFQERALHVLEGALLPVWDRLPGVELRVFNTDQRRVLGVLIPENSVRATLENFGVSEGKPDVPPTDEMLKKILSDNYVAELSNSWKIKRSRVSGEHRVEVAATFSRGDTGILKQQGAYTEIIANKLRVFIPSEGAGVLDRILQGKDVIRWESPSGRGAFTPDPTEQYGEEHGPEGGFALIPGQRPIVQRERKKLTMENATPDDPDIARFFKRTGRMTSPRKRLSDVVKAVGQGVSERFRYLHHIARIPETAFARERIRHTHEARAAAQARAEEHVRGYLDGETPKTREVVDAPGLEILTQKIFLEDMLHEAELAEQEAELALQENPDIDPVELERILERRTPKGLTKDKMETELDRVNRLVVQTPSVNDAYRLRRELWKKVSDDLRDRGVIDAETAKNVHYVRHFVLEYTDASRQSRGRGTGKKLKAPYRPYAKRRKGTDLDWSTDLLEVEVRALTDIYRDNIVQDLGEEVAHYYAKPLPENKGGKVLPDYEKWQFKRGNVFYQAKTLTESQLAQLSEEIAIDPGELEMMMKDVLVVGGKRKTYYIPNWLAAQLDDLPVQRQSNVVVSFTKPFIRAWKRWILRINPIRYNSRNAMGDGEGVNSAGQTKAFTYLPKSIEMLTTQESPKAHPEAYERGREYGVFSSSLRHEMGEVRKLEEFQRFADVRDLSGWKQAVEFLKWGPSKLGQSLQDITQFREDTLRVAVYLKVLDDIKAGRKLRHWSGRMGGIGDIIELAKIDPYMAAARVSRETLGDYGSFTPWENDYLRQGLMPFYSFKEINTKRWVRIPANAFLEGLEEGGPQAGTAKGVAAGMAHGATRVANMATRTLAAYGLLMLWNNRDEEARKREAAVIAANPWLKGKPHLTLDSGVVYTPSALTDFLEWFDLEMLAADMKRYEKGNITFNELLMQGMLHQAAAPINQIANTIGPFLKAGTRFAFGVSTFPRVTEPRFFYDAWTKKAFADAVLNMLGADTRRFLEVKQGKRTLNEVLAYYFSGSAYRPMNARDLEEKLLKTLLYSTLKSKSQVTGRGPGEAKKGYEDDYERALEGLKALGLSNKDALDEIRKDPSRWTVMHRKP